MEQHDSHLSLFNADRLVFVRLVHYHLYLHVTVLYRLLANGNVDGKVLHCVNHHLSREQLIK